MTFTTFPQEETIISNHEAQKQHVYQRRCSDTYQYPTNPSHQGSNKKGGRMKHHQDQDALRSFVGHIQNL